MAIKNFKTKEEALAAMKKATDRKRTLIEYLKKGVFLRRIGKMGFKMAKFAWCDRFANRTCQCFISYKVYINNNGSLGFETQYGSVYEVGFVEDYTFMDENAFQFLFWNHKVSIL